MMKQYIYNRIKQAESRIDSELTNCIKYRKAKDIDYKAMLDYILKPVSIKTMPKVYASQILSIFSFCYEREVSRYFLYPVKFNGKLYSKWNSYPEELKELIRSNSQYSLDNRPYPVFTWHFTEGMEAE